MMHDGSPEPAKRALSARSGRPRGRPSEMSPATLLEKIRALAGREDGLFRVHLTHGAVYARARRQFGSWAAAVAAAGQDYGRALETARRRSLENRRRARRRARLASRNAPSREPAR
jgi:hypothetical protein